MSVCSESSVREHSCTAWFCSVNFWIFHQSIKQTNKQTVEEEIRHVQIHYIANQLCPKAIDMVWTQLIKFGGAIIETFPLNIITPTEHLQLSVPQSFSKLNIPNGTHYQLLPCHHDCFPLPNIGTRALMLLNLQFLEYISFFSSFHFITKSNHWMLIVFEVISMHSLLYISNKYFRVHLNIRNNQ